MRIPNPISLEDGTFPNCEVEDLDIHYLTDFYIRETELDVVPFHNSDGNAYLKFYNYDRMTIDGK